MIHLIGLANCPTCHGTGIAVSNGVLNADRSAYTFAASQCRCVKVWVLSTYEQGERMSARSDAIGQLTGTAAGVASLRKSMEEF